MNAWPTILLPVAARADKGLESTSTATTATAATTGACMAMHDASSAIASKIEPFSGGATPPAESFLGFVVHIIEEDGDDETV